MLNSSNNSKRYDAIIIGARCAGAATAMLLARAGAKVLVVDRESYGADTLSTHALMRTGVTLLHRWGLLDRVIDAGTPAVRWTTFIYGDEQVGVEIKPSDGISALYAPRRTVLDPILVDAAIEAGAEVRYACALENLVYDNAGKVDGAVLRDRRGRSFTERADLVIGADGRQSTVASLVEAPLLAQTLDNSAGNFGYVPGIENLGYRWFFRPGLHLAVIPTNDDAHVVAVFAPRERYRDVFGRDAEAGFRESVASFDPALGGVVARSPVDRLRRYTGAPGHIRQCHGPGWALVGDSGYFKDPATAHGLTDALRDAELLVNAILDHAPDGLTRYQEVRSRLSLPLFEVTGEIAEFAWTVARLKELHVRLSAAMKMEQTYITTTPTRPPLAA
jgi:2-polyprenyl-6-methoxyphenol hydroxylase-like FAD-dependent oxidoreductase